MEQRSEVPVGWSDPAPTRPELEDIEAEWPVIAAELALLDAEIAALVVVGGMGELARRRVRRAERRVLDARRSVSAGAASAASARSETEVA